MVLKLLFPFQNYKKSYIKMKKVIITLLLFYSNFVYGQYKSIFISFYIDDSIQHIESKLKFTFRTYKDSCEIKVEDGKITLPQLCFQNKNIDMIISFQNEVAIISNIKTKQDLIYNETVNWDMGFDNYPFNKDIVKGFNLSKNTYQIFYWKIYYDEFVDLYVIPSRFRYCKN